MNILVPSSRHCIILIIALLWGLSGPARGQTATVATLARLGGDPDGFYPRAALIDGGDGFFCGTTEAGGPPDCGTVFKVAPSGALTTLYIFTGGNDGANPLGGLVRGSDGNFYGTTSGAGSGGTGTVFKITTAGTLTILYSFGAITGTALLSNAGGAFPHAALIQGTDGNLYGTANFGGTAGSKTVFRISPAGAFAKIVEFPDGPDGLPTSALVEAGDGNFYGVLATAGANANGSIYKVTPGGALTTFHDFAGGNEVYFPEAALVKGSDGSLYGTTASGGSGNSGTAFKITSTGTLTTLHAFASANEGQALDAPLTLGSDGNFYGATGKKGTTGFGAAYRLTPAGVLTVLAAFPGPGMAVTKSIANGLLPGGDGNSRGAKGNSTTGQEPRCRHALTWVCEV